MILRYKKRDGTQMEFELGDRPITIGRSPEADLVILDEKASRLHCGIRMWDGEFYIKDLKSRNGTHVNGQPVEMAKLNPGDRVRIGSCTFSFESDLGKGTQTILKEVEDEMSQGKGYTTLLREIIRHADGEAPAAAQEPVPVRAIIEPDDQDPAGDEDAMDPTPVPDLEGIPLATPASDSAPSDDPPKPSTQPIKPIGSSPRKPLQVRIRRPIKKIE